MNFLELCREVARESGTLAGGAGEIITVVDNKVGRIAKIVAWVRDAWVSIQLEHNDWFWMQREFSSPLSTGVMRYAPLDLSLARVAAWILDDCGDPVTTIQNPSADRSDESQLRIISFGEWRARYGRGQHDASRPTEIAVGADGRLAIGARPDQTYTLRGMYRAAPQVLAANTDVPEMPAHFHKLIVWEAIKLASIHDEAPFTIQTSVGEYARLRDALVSEQRPKTYVAFDSDTVIA